MTYPERWRRVRERMVECGVDALLCSVGADLPWLTGYTAMPLERLTMLVVVPDAEPVLVVPELEAARVEPRPDFVVRAWGEHEDPVEIVAGMVAGARRIAIGDRTWARFVLALQHALPAAAFTSGTEVTGPLRAVKDVAEIEALARAARSIDEVATSLRATPFAGRREVDLAREIADRILGAGHERVNFVVVASGPNAASAHHEPGPRVIGAGDPVLVDIGGTMHGYCSDITRMFCVGDPAREVRDAYSVLRDAQEAGVQAGTVGTPCEAVDAAARSVLTAAGLGEYFVHRTGHGIGIDEHEDPYIVHGNEAAIVAGNAFSVEPGIYVPGRFGMRLEDIVVATADGPRRLNHAARDIAIVG